MAALIKHVLSKLLPTAMGFRAVQRCNPTKHELAVCQFHAVKKPHKNYFFKGKRKVLWQNPIKPVKKIESVVTGIAARGFLRPLKDYTPPEDVIEKCDQIFSTVLGPEANDAMPMGDPESRFAILNQCFKEFKHSVPNSLLHKITTIGDLKDFYCTPISTTTPLDKLRTMDLPPNLHVQYEPLRFHPETDNSFDGKTAFPGSSTLVTGLRTRKKYPSYIIPENYIKE